MDGADVLRGDVVLVPFPYVTDFKKAKTRPALVIQNNVGNRFGSTVIVALISSVRRTGATRGASATGGR